MKDFAKCESADEFRCLTSRARREGILNRSPSQKFPVVLLCPPICFKIFGEEAAMRAGDLAMKALKNFALGTGEKLEEEKEGWTL
jgi:hypothetical protein